MEFVSPVVDVINLVLDRCISHVAYIVRYRQNVDELYDSVKDLGDVKGRVNHQCDEAEKNVRNTEGMVTEWLRKVGEFETKVEEFGNVQGHTKIGISNCLFPYLWNRYRLSRQAKKMAEDVQKLKDESPKFDEIAYRENVTSNDATLSNAGFMEFGSTKSTMEEIMAQLEDSTVRMIGLYGPGGVGKSTLIKEIAKKARHKKLFNVVAISEITANPNLQKIQEEIAYVLGLRLEGEGENVRADCLRRRLRKEKESTLIILDDLWDKLDLNKLGIPLDDDKDALMKVVKDENSKKKSGKMSLNHEMVEKEMPLGDYKGCKILLTSRDKKVLSDKMDVKSFFCIEKLDEKDALMLFQKVARIPDEMSILKQDIVKKYCAGLPMAIVTVARALRDKSDSVWEATLDNLKKQDLVEVQNSMEISVKMSYDHLETEELKFIFLLSAQMGHQPLIMDLVKYCFGLGILEGIHSLGEARERIRISIQKLKDSTLMLDVNSSNHFNMHDMVRDAALSTAHKEQNVFTLRNGQLDGWHELERCTSISICNSDIIDEFPNVLNCPQLQFFQIDSDDPSLKIPDSFFKRMKKLRVLILNGIHLTSLPSSIKCLSNLRMLCLERCTLDGDLSSIEKLKNLRILSFSGSQIKILPAQLGCLDKLQSLDISNCSIDKMIQPNPISGLTCLEELYIRKSLFDKLAKGEKNQSQISFLSELTHLHQLKVVDLVVPCAAVLPKDLFFDKLNDYKIVIGDFRTFSVGDFRMPNKYEKSRSLALQLKDDNDNIQSQERIKFLFKRVENLLLGDLNDVENVIDQLNLDGFPYLKHLSISDNSHIKYIIKKVDFSHPQEVFPNLESLCLNKLRNMEKIHCSPVTYASFSRLKSIKVKMCAQLKNLFSIHFSESNSLKEIIEIPVSCLSNLEIIDISESYSLKEIVEVEIPVNCDKVQFLKLHSLTLHSLPSLSSFYTRRKMPSVPQSAEAQTSKNDHIDVEDKTTLFGKQVEIPNLESLNLSSINIRKIWSDKPLSNFCFENLIKLVVKDCNQLRHLCSLSVASGLNKLKGLFISECRMMEKLFNSEGNSADKVQVFVFPKLEEIHLSQMSVLTEIWQPEVNADSFSSLISVHIERCEKLDKIFSTHMEGWFASLDTLKVVHCKSVEVIFEIEDSQQIDASGGIDTNLQHIVLDGLPNLKHVWSTNPGGILNFKKLQGLEVYSCHKLCNVFPASVAKDAEKLERMLVVQCMGLVEIVACEDGSEANNEPLVFPELTRMVLGDLPNIKHFYDGGHPIECPKLKILMVGDCRKLKTFQTPTSEITNVGEKAVFSAKKIIPNLEHLVIDYELQKWLLSNTVKYQMHSLKGLALLSVNNSEHLGQFFYRAPNLEKFQMFDFEKLSLPCLGTLLQLKELYLNSSDIKDLRFEREPVLQRLELLSLHECDNLIKLAPPLISLTYLTYLEVQSCNGLKNLMASSTAKSLVQLKTMKVIECNKIKEIVTNAGNEVEDIDIVFCKLITVELVALKCLTSFCSDKSCKFKFPSLEILIVRECPMMEEFSESPASAPKLQNILAVEGQEDAKWQWEGDGLNTTLQKVFKDKVSFAYTEHLNLSDHLDILDSLWHRKVLVQENCFRNLKKLSACKCDSLEYVIPSHLLPCFEKLEELVVQNCHKAQVIFNINDEIRGTKVWGIIRLKQVILDDLPKLEHVWDKDPEGIIGLQVLQDMSVKRCHCLKSLFPASVAKDLARLEVLEVKDCKELEEIFSEDEDAEEGETKMFVFSCLTSLRLEELPELKYLYPRLHTLELPGLQELHAIRCELVTLKFQENHPQEQALIQIDQKVIQIPSFKKLSFRIGDTKVTWDRESGQLQFKYLESFEEESISCPLYRFLNNLLPTIEKLVFKRCLFEELFSTERPNADYNRILLHLKGLHVTYCNDLTKLIPGTVSFSNLTHLEVSECSGLLYLFTSSTVKSLARLKKIEIKNCESLKEIVSTGGDDESREDEQIIFGQLQVLYLEKLGELNCFYPGNCTLCFPCLEKVYVIDCRSMKTFSPVNKIDHSTDWFSTEDATPQQECDLNSAARRTFWEMPPELILGDSPLQEIWHDHSLSIPDSCFSNLHSLIVDGCEFSDVLPFNLLPFLAKLETLEVRNCNSVETIFDVKYITQNRIMTTTEPTVFPLPFLLKKLILQKLPKLENVWNEDPCGILSMQLLQEVRVGNCECLISVFPISIAKDLVKLENLFVQGCEELVAIVTEDNPHPREANLDLTFPCMTSLTLCDLPKLKYFYNCSLECDMLKTSTHLESQTENQVWIKLTPNLQHLTLGGIELKMFCRGDFQGNLLYKLKDLIFQNFHVESSDVFPAVFLQQVPNIESLEVRDSSFKEIFCFQSPNVDDTGLLSQLKLLRLESLPELVSIGTENAWTEPFIKNLETLEVTRCFSSKNLVSCRVSFSNLTCLKVKHCDSLLYLFPSSTAKSLAQLKTMVIKRCNSIEEIVTKEGDESHEDEIIFQQLNCLKLKYLENLRSFCKGNLSFPSMDQLSVVECEKMKTLCSGTVKADKLFEATLDWDDITLENDLNSTMREAFLAKTARSISNLKLRDSPDLQEIWHGSLPIPDSCFRNLECLIVHGCQFLSDVVLPFNLLPFFTKLETLEVGNCDYVKTIFDVKCMKQDRIIPSPLKKLTLSKLPNLENVWNEDPHGILSMQLLQQVYVDNCKCLTSVFPTSVAKDLVKLEDLVVQHCEGMMVIVAEDNADQRGTIVELTFPNITSLTLWDLPKLEYQVCIEKLTPNLENLVLGEHELKMIWHGEFQGNLQHKLKVLTLTNIDSSNVFAYVFQQQVLNIEKLEVSCSFEEIFCFQSPNNAEDTGLLSQLTFELSSFSSLRNLAPFPTCFLNLTCLFVFECHRLENLFTSSTAKSLTRLKIMEIKCCESIKEIVSDGSHEDEIIFWKLLYLNLESLSNLTSFYRGSLSFPSLVQLSVINCQNMENLCAGTIYADKLLEVKFQKNSDAIPLQIDINSIIWKTFLATISESARSVSYLELRDKPNLQKIWHGSVPIPDMCFSNLHSLIVDRCQFLSDVLPFYLLPFLTKLETLEVRNCDSVKTIFDLKCITTEDRKIMFPLKKLILSELPNLENVWNEDPYEILTMQFLQQVCVNNCKCLTSVFPTSVTKDLVKLESLVVQHCEGLMAIVAEDNADPKGTNLDLTFPSMVSMTLWDLPTFKKITHVEPHTEDQVCIEKLTPNLEHLTLGENELKVIWHEEFQGNMLHKLKVLILLNCNESSVLAHGCVQQVPNKDKLEGSSYSFKVISCYESPNVDHTEPQSQLKVLTLESLPEPFVRNLEFLELSSSSCLTNLAPFHICFPNLMGLFVSECHQLENLFTSSIAKSLARIKIMEIKSSESIKEIVSDGSQEDEIIFGQLLYLNLESLPNLTSFYKGSLSFPSLVQLSIINCHNMENICAGTINADKLLQVKFQNNSDAIPLEIDLNSTIRKTLHATAFDYLSSSSSDTNEDSEYVRGA